MADYNDDAPAVPHLSTEEQAVRIYEECWQRRQEQIVAEGGAPSSKLFGNRSRDEVLAALRSLGQG